MRRLHSFVLATLATLAGPALVACGEEKAREQKVATLRGEGFTVQMPGNPKRSVITAQTPAGPVPITAYISEGGEEGFSMSSLKIPAGVQGDLDGAVRGAASQVEGTVRSSVKTTHQSFPARDARIADAEDANGRKGTVFLRVILAKGRVFQLQFVTAGGDVPAPTSAYRAFVASLKIT